MKRIVLSTIILLIVLSVESYTKKYRFTYDNNGNRITRTFSVNKMAIEDTVNISTVEKYDVKVYPNPTKGQLTLNIANLGNNDKVQMFLIDFSGNELAKMDFTTAENTVDLSRQTAGTYFLRVVIGEQSETFKIIKME